MAGRKIEVQIVGDSRSLDRAFRSASGSARGFGSAALGAGRSVALGLGAGLAAAALAAKKTADAASNLGESVNAVNVVFGKAATQVHEFSRKAGAEAGLSMRQFNELVTPIGAALQNVGFSADEAAKASINLGKRAADMASVFNTDVNDAMMAIQAGLRGEADPLERFGVGLSDAAVKAKALALNLAENEKSLTANDKAQARLALLMEQTNRLSGDFKNTSDSLANSQRILKSELENIAAEIGTAFLPAISGAVSHVSDFVSKLSQAKGFKAKIEVVLEGAETLAQKALKVGQDVGAQIMTALSSVNWTDTGNDIAASIGSALKSAIPKAFDLAGAVAAGMLRAVQEVDWVVVGRAIGQGIKDGTVKGAKDFVKEGGLKLLADLANPLGLVAREVGRDVGDHFGRGVAQNTKKGIGEAYAPVPELIARGLQPGEAVAFAGGRRIGAGLSSGLTAALSGVGASVAATIISQINMSELQIKQQYGIHSPSRVWAERIGKPLGDGIGVGVKGSLQAWFPEVHAWLKAYTAKLEAQVRAARDRLGAAMGSLQDKLLRAFDAETSGQMTPAEAEIAAINARRRLDDLNKALADARASGDSAAIARAEEDLRLHSLELQAATERKAWDDQRAAMRENLEKRLAALSAHFTKEGATVKTALAAIQKLMLKFGISFEEAGEYIGTAFMRGLANAVGGAAGAASGVNSAKGGMKPKAEVIQVQIDGRVVAEVVRKENAAWERVNGAFAV
jgi:hypothetical protein